MYPRLFLFVLIIITANKAKGEDSVKESPDHPEGQLNFPPRCQDCIPGILDVVGTLNLQQMMIMFNLLRPIQDKWDAMTKDLSKKMYGNILDLTQELRRILTAIKNNIVPLIDELIEALPKIFKCRTVPVLFINLKNNLLAVLNDVLNQKYEPFFRPKDLGKLMDGLANTLDMATPSIVKLIQQLLTNLLELFGMCKDLYVVVVLFLSESSLTNGVQMVIAILKELSGEMAGKSMSDLAIQKGRLALPTILKTLLEKVIGFINIVQTALDGGGLESLFPEHLAGVVKELGLNVNSIEKVIQNLAQLAGGSLGDTVKAFSGKLGKLLYAAYQDALKQEL